MAVRHTNMNVHLCLQLLYVTSKCTRHCLQLRVHPRLLEVDESNLTHDLDHLRPRF